MHELTVAAKRFSDAGGWTAFCVSASAGATAPRSTAAIESQSLSSTSAASFKAASKASVNLSDMTLAPDGDYMDSAAR